MDGHRSRAPFSRIAAAAVATTVACGDAGAGDLDVSDPYFLTDELVDKQFSVKIGDWELEPSLSIGGGHSDNIEESDVGGSDWFQHHAAGLELRGQIGETGVELGGFVDARLPFDTPDENELYSELSLELDREFSDQLRGNLLLEFVDYWPGIPDDEIDREQNFTLKPTLVLDLDEWRIELRGTAAKINFLGAIDDDDNPVTDPRQHRYGDVTLIVGRRISDGLTVYLGALARLSEYDLEFDEDGFTRGGKGYGIFAGIRGSLTDTIEVDLSAGVSHQDFRDTAFADVSYPTVNGYVQYRPLENVRFSFVGESGFHETDDYGAPGYVSHEGSIRAEIKPADRLVFIGQIGHEYLKYREVGITENTTEVETGLDLALSAYVVASLRYIFRSRRSDDPEETFDSNTFLARITFN